MPDCKEILDKCLPEPRVAEAWSVCLPWGGRIWSDGEGVYAQHGSPPPDGTYGKVIIANGCIVGVEDEDVPVYTGSPCAPLPGDCAGGGSPGVSPDGSGSGGGGGGCCAPSSASGNLYQLDATGKPLVKVSIKGGDGLNVTGSGTASDPFVISNSSGGGVGVSGVYIRSANDAISVSGAGTRTDPIVLTHKAGLQTNVNGMVFDAYGHLISSGSGSTNKGITSIVAGEGLDATTDQATGVTTIGLTKLPDGVAGDYSVGGYKISVDRNGRLYAVEQEINLGEWKTCHWGTHDVTVNPTGSITAITETYDPGTAFLVGWGGSDSQLTHRWGKFNMRIPANLHGFLTTAGSKKFWDGVAVYIDGVPCHMGDSSCSFDLPTGGTSTGDSSGGSGQVNLTTEVTWITTFKPFNAAGTFLAGEHSVDVYANGEPWQPNIGASILLWPCAIFADDSGQA